ncbi:hypothetical protein ECANGB1_1190 [Enterospora canceri]|uniref:V-type proton ATPase subunit G n=1 Tax=Enterospora canceri TaxID=1081671 RepID=A0A1Y1S428_9MICR|nr:hypothetical protein ECANGB1_1190 [Enterospora canceri]
MTSDGIKLVIQAENDASNKIKAAKEYKKEVVNRARKDAADHIKALEEDLKNDLERKNVEDARYLEELKVCLETEFNKKVGDLDEKCVDDLISKIVGIIADK